MGFNLYEWSARAYLRYVTWRRGELVGTDRFGNKYYRKRRTAGSKPEPRSVSLAQERRWVVFNGGESEASRVPPEWHGWLHHQTKDPPSETSPLRRDWQKEHIPNPTGSAQAYRPPGSVLSTGQRDRATGDYEPWVPS